MFVGQPFDRRDGRLKVTGAARYAAEFSPKGVVHAVLVRSTIAAGSITAIDGSGALAMPGVLAVITPDNALRLHVPQGAATPPALLQDNEVLFAGQPVAIAVADTLDHAIAAASAIHVTYRDSEAVTRMEQALGAAVPPRHFRNGMGSPDSHRGDPDGAFAGAAVKIEATYRTPIEHHNPMEPHATVAAWEGDKLTVWTSTQGISTAQATFARWFGLPPAQVRVICPFVGGGFGCKGTTWQPAVLTVMAAKFVGRPVKMAITRAQMFTSNGYRPMTVQKLRLAASGDGTLLSIRHDGISQMSMPALGEFTENVALATQMAYACPNVATSHRIVSVNAGLPTYMRAPGESSGMFALESAVDELAAALRMDPLALRLRNYAETDPSDGRPFSSKLLRQCYERGAAAFGWDRRLLAPRSMREGGKLIGMGMATAAYPTNRSPAGAIVRVNANGTAVVGSGTQDIGTGTYTVMAQVAADALHLPYSHVRFDLGDSRLPHAPNSGGSQTVASVAPAVMAAAEAALQQVFATALADPRLGWQQRSAADLRFENGFVVAPDGRVHLSELLAHVGKEFIEARADAAPGAERKEFSMHSFGAQFAEVEVDPDIGRIRLRRLLGAFDTGRVLNAKTAHSQMLGGIVFGVGMALFERTEVDAETGRIVNDNIADYLLPVNADIPDIDVIMVENDDLNTNPAGAKGIGELPMVGVAAAIANAVWHASGVRVRDLPIRLENVLA